MKVLVVEDERRLAASLRKGLTAEGHAVEMADDREQAVRMATEGTFDAIVLDVMLPDRHAFEVCEQLRSIGVWTPILLLTPRDGGHDVAEALDTGADDILTKPFSQVALLDRLRAITRQSTERPPLLTVDDLVLDPARRRCSRGGAEIALTPKEFTVLEYLMRHCDEVVSKAEILAHGWDFSYEGDRNIIEVYVSNLRRKIDAPFKTANLRTVWGVGYEFTSNRPAPATEVSMPDRTGLR